MGTLRITGIIELNQFWPQSSSDADTTKMKLIVGDDSFEYREDGTTVFKKTLAFKNAVSKGQGTRPVINTSVRTGEKSITVRLQGVDAPELHYQASALKKDPAITAAQRKEYNDLNRKEKRQHFAESATVALMKHLKKFSKNGFVPVWFQSKVDKPFEVVDTYGRFVGEIMIGEDHNLNIWLLENGWCMPTFYTSMKKEEIETFLAAWKKGKTKKGRTSKSLIKDMNKFDWEMLYRLPGTVSDFKIGDDKGKTIMPKIFRRQVAWQTCKKAKVIAASTSFASFLKKKPDQLVLLNDFLLNGLTASRVFAIHHFINADGKLTKNPEDIILQEKAATMVDENNKKIETW